MADKGKEKKKNSFIDNAGKCFGTLILLSLLVTPGSAAAFENTGNTCAGAAVIPLNGSLRETGDIEGESHFFKLEVPAAGLVMLDVAVPGTAGAEAKLGLVGRGCDEPSLPAGDSGLIEQTARRLVWLAEVPDTYVFAVAAQDPRGALGHYRLTAGFVAAEGLDPAPPGLDPAPPGPLDTTSGDDGGESEDELEDEPDAPLSLPLDPPAPLMAAGGEPHPGRGARPGLPAAASLIIPEPRQLCGRLEIDDHGDTVACATRLRPGRSVRGDVDNPWGDDQDLFRFTLTEPRTVHVATTGSTDTFGVLRDSQGHLLAADDDSGGGDNFRIVKTLAPGLYFLRIEGAYGAEGSYRLRFEARSW